MPEALKHWNALLGLGLEIKAIPVDTQGRHDLGFIREHAPRAGLVCTMAANNETRVVSDLAGIEAALEGSDCFWMVDGVQALGKLPLKLAASRIDYAPFSGHKLYAPKGIGLPALCARRRPFTPLMAGGGQEGSLRSGTENMSGIAALGAVLAALEDGSTFRSHAELTRYRSALAEALRGGLQHRLQCAAGTEPADDPELRRTRPEFAVAARPVRRRRRAGQRQLGLPSAAKAAPSFVLQAMGLPDWQAAGAVRLSIGPPSMRPSSTRPALASGLAESRCRRTA